MNSRWILRTFLTAAVLFAAHPVYAALWISHGGNFGSAGAPAGQVGVYTAPNTFNALQSYRGVSGLAYGNGVVYAYVGAGNYNQGQLKTIDPTTGAELSSITEPLNSFGDTGLNPQTDGHLPLGDLAVDPTTGILYGAAANGSADAGGFASFSIFAIDPTDGSRTRIGSPAATLSAESRASISIAFDDAGRLFAMTWTGEYFAQLDKTDGSFIAGSNITLPAGATDSAIGLGFDSDAGLFVGSYWSDVSGYVSGLMTIDPDNGYAVTDLGDFGDARQIHDITFVPDQTPPTNPIPEPATAGLLGLAAMGLLARRRRSA